MLRIFLLLLLNGGLALSAFCQPNPKRVLVTDLTRLKQVGAVQLSPDARRVVYTLTNLEPNTDQPLEYDYRTHLYLADLTSKQPPRALTSGAGSASQPAWSPDGKTLAFARFVKGKPQIFLLPMDGSGGEAQQLTTLTYGASNPVWSPDGKRLAFSATLTFAEVLADSLVNPGGAGPRWSTEKPGFVSNDYVKPDKAVKPNPDGSLAEIRAYLQKDVVDKKAKVINRLNFQGEATTEPEMSFSHLYVQDVAEGSEPRQAVARPITRGFATFAGAAWLPDGKTLLAVTDRDPNQHPDRMLDNAIVAVPIDGNGTAPAGTPERDRYSTLLAAPGKSYFAPEVSPDGKQLAFLVSESEGVNFPKVGVATVSTGTPERDRLSGIAASNLNVLNFDRSAGGLKWVANVASTGKKAKNATLDYALYFTAPSNGGVPLFRYRTGGPVAGANEPERLTDFNTGTGDFDVAGGTLVFARTEVTAPAALYRADLSAQNVQLLSNPNEWVAQKQLSVPEKATFQNELGQTVEYWIMKPTFATSGKKYPLLLNMHGGPTAMWGPGEASMWHEFQFLCGQGYGIVYANPRGSGGYGLAFQQANTKDWGTGPASDVLRAATEAAKQPWADTTRQVLTGGSYAGYLTAWIVGHDNRFKAAFAQRGVYDLTTFLGEGNAWRLVPNYFDYPWKPGGKAVLDANSPYTFVENIKTPLLIKHGENDLRTGVIQSEMLYKSLKILGRPVEYVRMPGATHELSRSGNPRQRIDRLLRIYEFFERYVGPDARLTAEKK